MHGIPLVPRRSRGDPAAPGASSAPADPIERPRPRTPLPGDRHDRHDGRRALRPSAPHLGRQRRAECPALYARRRRSRSRTRCSRSTAAWPRAPSSATRDRTRTSSSTARRSCRRCARGTLTLATALVNSCIPVFQRHRPRRSARRPTPASSAELEYGNHDMAGATGRSLLARRAADDLGPRTGASSCVASSAAHCRCLGARCAKSATCSCSNATDARSSTARPVTSSPRRRE